MRHINDAGQIVLPPKTNATNATHSCVWDCKGFDQANFFVGMNTHATNKAALSVCKFTEGTNSACGDAIVALTGGTATSSSAGFVIPAATAMGPGAAMTFNIDLTKRKRYMKLNLTPGDATANETYALGLLSRAAESKDTAAEKQVQDLSSTSNTQCALVVNA
jgi:hypothetical protein